MRGDNLKIEHDELLEYYQSGPINESFNWFDMDTTGAKNLSDKDLLGRIATLPLVSVRGFGLIAELCKRFNNIED